MMSGSGANLKADGVTLRNLKGAMYKMGACPLSARVTSMASQGSYVFIATLHHGCSVFRVQESSIEEVIVLGKQPTDSSKASAKDEGSSCYDVTVSDRLLAYIKEEAGTCSLCVHDTKKVLEGATEVERCLQLNRPAPMVLEPHLNLLVLGGAAWTASWTGGGGREDSTQDSNESHVRVLDLPTFEVRRDWKVTENSVSMLRTQITADHSMLGVADSRTGIKVFDLRQPTEDSYVCLYQVPVEEIRNFRLVGDFVGVFHKFEPNVTFWNMNEQRTILCINIQDQMRELAEEFLEDDEDDCGLFGDEDDHVTAVTCVPSDEDYLLIYGTKSACIFGMSVDSRTKLFNIPCPHESPEESPPVKRNVRGICFVPEGKLVVCYENHGLTVLDFSPENPPDRPPTRHQKRST